MTFSLDMLDRKILTELDRNARITTSELARKVKHGRDIVDYRINRLYNEGVIAAASVVVNPYVLGLSLYKIYFKVKNEAARSAALLKVLQTHPSIFCYAECDGNWDFIFTIIARSTFEFDEIYNTIISRFEDIIIEHQFAMIVSYHAFSRKYFLKSTMPHVFLVGGKPLDLALEDEEYRLIAALGADARLGITKLADVTGMTPAMVRTRMEKLERERVILGYRLRVDRKSLGMTSFKSQLELATYQPTKIEALIKYCTAHRAISKCVVQLGCCKLECNFDVQNYDEFSAAVAEMKQQFVDVIRNSTVVILRNEVTRWVYQRKRVEASVAQAA